MRCPAAPWARKPKRPASCWKKPHSRGETRVSFLENQATAQLSGHRQQSRSSNHDHSLHATRCRYSLLAARSMKRNRSWSCRTSLSGRSVSAKATHFLAILTRRASSACCKKPLPWMKSCDDVVTAGSLVGTLGGCVKRGNKAGGAPQGTLNGGPTNRASAKWGRCTPAGAPSREQQPNLTFRSGQGSGSPRLLHDVVDYSYE